MKKLWLLSAFLPLFLWGCSFDLPSPANIDIKTVVSSGTEMLSGARDTAKEISQQYYEDQIQPIVNVAHSGVNQAAETIKNQYNQKVDQLHDAVYNQSEQAKDQIGRLKIE